MASETLTFAVLILLVSAVASLIATGLLRRALLRRQVMDLPNDRSSHDLPTPRGGGIAVIGVLAASWCAIGLFAGGDFWFWPPIAGAVALAALSFLDDLRGLGALVRLGAQTVVVAVVWDLGGMPGSVSGGLVPAWIEAAVCCLAWVWFVNLYNFMDGVDGIAGAQTIAVGVGVAALSLLGAAPASFLPVAAALIGVALGFLRWNWRPARIFLGDVGSVPLGFILGWMLLWLAASGYWAAALILPLYYLVDATLTLLRRALRGEKVWRAHNQHFYQRAVQGGHGHDAVVLRIAIANACLIVLAGLALWRPVASVGVATLVVLGLMRALHVMSHRGPGAAARGRDS